MSRWGQVVRLLLQTELQWQELRDRSVLKAEFEAEVLSSICAKYIHLAFPPFPRGVQAVFCQQRRMFPFLCDAE